MIPVELLSPSERHSAGGKDLAAPDTSGLRSDWLFQSQRQVSCWLLFSQLMGQLVNQLVICKLVMSQLCIRVHKSDKDGVRSLFSGQRIRHQAFLDKGKKKTTNLVHVRKNYDQIDCCQAKFEKQTSYPKKKNSGNCDSGKGIINFIFV